MDMLINITLLALGFIGAVAAIGGDTWLKGEQKLYQRITRRGWIAIISLSLTLTLGIIKEVRSISRADKLQAERADLQKQLSTTAKKLNETNEKLIQTRRKLIEIEPNILEAMYKLTERIVRESDFAFLSLRGQLHEYPRSSDTGQNLKLYGGDELEYHLFCSSGGFGMPSRVHLLLEVGTRRYPVDQEHGVIRIAGPIGQSMPAVIINEERRSDCDMKIIVKSTDRTRIQTQFSPLLKAIEEAKAEAEN